MFASFEIKYKEVIILTPEQAESFFEDIVPTSELPGVVEQMTSGPCMALALTKVGVVNKLLQLFGSEDAAKQTPNS